MPPGRKDFSSWMNEVDKQILTTQRALSSVGNALVSSLPSSPTDGMNIYFQSTVMAAAGAVWHLRYRSDSPSSYKWECVGGTAMWASVGSGGTDETTTSTAYTNLSTVGPTLVLPLAGDYITEFDIEAFRNDGGAGNDAYIAFQHSGVTNNAAHAERISNGSGALVPGSARRAWISQAAGDVMQAKYAVSSGTGRFRGMRTLSLLPIRVG